MIIIIIIIMVYKFSASEYYKRLIFTDCRIPEGKAPRFPKKPTIRQEGDSLILECVCEAHPFPEVTWFLGSKKIMEGVRHKTARKEISKHTYHLSLEIRVSTKHGSPLYAHKCKLPRREAKLVLQS